MHSQDLIKGSKELFKLNQVIKMFTKLAVKHHFQLPFSNANGLLWFTIKNQCMPESSDQSTIEILDPGCKCINRQYKSDYPLVVMTVY